MPAFTRPPAAGTLFVPGEDVLLLAVDLPLASAARRLEALPFAIEDRIADPIEAVHLAIGGEIGSRRYLVAVVRHAAMQGWIAGDGGAQAALVPDVLALPMPAPATWTVDLRGARALVRREDGTGFALPAAQLEAVWRAAGRPPCHAVGEALAPAFGMPADPPAEAPPGPTIDLRQGIYARALRRLEGPWRRVAIVIAIGLCGHLGLLMADTLALRRIADDRRDETRALIARAAPGQWGGDDVMTVAMDLLPASDRGAGPLMPLLARASAGLAPLMPALAVRSIAFDAGAATLTLDLEARDAATLARAARALGAAAPVPVAEGGRVHALLAVRGGPLS
ncbi:type II secretion system protein GspL [Sphingomonas profundi]|uniref:type II secretion system protein GspL n=1 Tax=Alterirhizorhabdus profundi TaxID=2681549 RepID=UPI0018D022CF|nr:type II secretion system protein GspL [Sphingomonas profundi]